MKRKNSTIEKLKEEGKVKKASEIPVPECKIEVIETTVLEGLQEMKLDQENGKRLRYLAKAKKVSIEDLFVWVEENYGKKVEKAAKGLKQRCRSNNSRFHQRERSRETI